MSNSLFKNFGRAFAFLFVLTVSAFSTQAATIYGVNTANQLVRFDSSAPNAVTTVGTITGLQAGENILGIDFRPANGQLYALGSTNRLYLINTINGSAAQVGAAGAFALNGTDFGFDFNPTVDRIRVVSGAGQNLRLNPNDGALAATDTPLNPGVPNITASAYTNNFAGATTTTLYNIDATTDALYTQVPPNNGTLNLVGALGVNTSGVAGFDIDSRDGTAYAALTVGANSQLYTINLATGAATLVGAIGGQTLRGMAVAFGSAATMGAMLDFDGDRRADFANYRLANNTWIISRSGGFFAQPFGAGNDFPTAGDFDGDGRADIAVWRPSTGTFFVLRSSTGSLQVQQFGQNGDQPVARDFDGDGRTDFAVVRRAGGVLNWFILNSSSGSFRAEQFGLATDSIAPGDYDGDGRFDLAVKRGGAGVNATYFILQSTAGFRSAQFGFGDDVSVPGDYDGDGKTDLAVIREGSNWNWYVLQSSNNALLSVQFGAKGQLSAQADYDGDGRTDIATFEPFSGSYYFRRSGNGAVAIQPFGQNGDIPVANYNSF